MRIYDTVILSDDQVASLYRGSYNVKPTYWWKLDEGTGNITDQGLQVGTDSDGTISGAVWTTSNFTVDGAARMHANGGLT